MMRHAVLVAGCLAFAAHAATPLPEYVKPDGPLQAVIYSEHVGNAGVDTGGRYTVMACRSLCPSHALPGKKCVIEGDAERHGEYLRRTWRTVNAQTDYTETWAMLAVAPTDICSLRLQLLRTLRVETFNEKQGLVLRIDLNSNEGTRQVIQKSRRGAAGDVERKVEALRASGYESAGTARYAGYTCRLLRRIKGELVQETCLLEDSAAPDSALGVPLRHMTLAHSMMNPAHPEARTYGETQLLQLDAVVPAAVFAPPANIQWGNPKK